MTGRGLSAHRGIAISHGPTPDSQWLAAVLREYEHPLTLYATRITKDLERARDVVQEAFLRLMREDRQLIEPRVAEWLYTVCRNKALDVRRKESRMTALSDTAAELRPVDAPDPGDVLIRREAAGRRVVLGYELLVLAFDADRSRRSSSVVDICADTDAGPGDIADGAAGADVAEALRVSRADLELERVRRRRDRLLEVGLLLRLRARAASDDA